MELTVVGTGVAGSSLARLARERGHTVRLIGGKPLASLAALAVVRTSYVNEPDAKDACAYAIEQYLKAGCEVIRGATVSSPRARTKREEDWWAVEPGPFLVPLDERREVEPGWADPRADLTIHATGAQSLSGEITYGVTWINADPGALKVDGLVVHRYAPYRSVDAVRFQRGCRVGSSSSKTEAGARKEAVKLMELATELGWVNPRAQPWATLTARRVKRETLSERLNRKVWTFGGFHRNGWSLAPLRAKQLLDVLEAS
jgi:hypothetical protein